MFHYQTGAAWYKPRAGTASPRPGDRSIAVLGGVTIGSTRDLLVAALLFGILNTFLKPLLRFATLPFALITLRLVWFGVSMLMLALTAGIVGSFEINGFWALVWATLIVWVVNLVLDIVPGPWRHSRRD